MNFAAFIRRNPRLPRLFAVRALALSFALGGCVPATSYEQANSAAEVEREGHRRTAEKMKVMERELEQERAEKAAIAAQKAELEKQLAAGENELAQISLEKETSTKASEQQAELVTQLRGELARVGSHLKEYEGDKQSLRDELDDAKKRLADKDRQIALLESQIARLKSEASDSEDAAAELSGALADLEELQNETAAPEAKAPADSKSSAEEVLPAEESAE